MNEEELRIFRILDSIVRQDAVKAIIDSIVLRVEQKLSQEPEALLAGEPVPLDTYGGKLPEIIRSSWVFIIRATADTDAEKHPNSHQRMISYRGSGDLQILTGETWRSNLLVSDINAPLESRCLSIPPHTWHQAVVPQENWVVVSFHTVPEDELIEERLDPFNEKLTNQRRCLD